jgi:predicted type IV restriction endonuclease
MMSTTADFVERIRVLAARVEKQKDNIVSEEACKNAFVMPFLNALGYDVFNPEIVVPEFTADVGIKKGEKVDYAIKIDGIITMLVECKCCGSDLALQHMSQLYRYFSVTDARFAILTTGQQYWFYSDLDAQNKMDQRPFFRFDILDYRPSHIAELSKFTSDQFDLVQILATASNLKYSSAIQQEFAKELEEPSDEIIKIFAARVYDGHFTKKVRDDFRDIVSNAFKEAVRELVSKRLTSALEVTNERSAGEGQVMNEDAEHARVETTPEEIEAFHIVKSLMRTVVKADRVVMCDAKSYCAVLLDDNNRKTLTRFHFNRAKKYISLFANKKEKRIQIETLEDIYEHAERLQATAREYLSE